MEKYAMQQLILRQHCAVIYVIRRQKILTICQLQTRRIRKHSNSGCPYYTPVSDFLNFYSTYKLRAEVHKSRVSDKSDKEKIKCAKEHIQKEFREKLALLVDIPKAGFGNTNDGNTSRRFFNCPEEAATITGIELPLIQKFKTILEVLSSGFEIDLTKFSKFTMDTAKDYVELYPWQPMSPTVHKILIHSTSVIANALLPIWQLSEEAAEARNKHFREYRQSFSRKFSRTACNEDVLNRLLLTSDPYLSNIRPRNSKKKETFSKEAIFF